VFGLDGFERLFVVGGGVIDVSIGGWSVVILEHYIIIVSKETEY